MRSDSSPIARTVHKFAVVLRRLGAFVSHLETAALNRPHQRKHAPLATDSRGHVASEPREAIAGEARGEEQRKSNRLRSSAARQAPCADVRTCARGCSHSASAERPSPHTPQPGGKTPPAGARQGDVSQVSNEAGDTVGAGRESGRRPAVSRGVSRAVSPGVSAGGCTPSAAIRARAACGLRQRARRPAGLYPPTGVPLTSGSDRRDGVPLAPAGRPAADSLVWALLSFAFAGRPAADSLAVALLSFASALIAPRLAVARRSLAQLAVPADPRGPR